MSKAELGVVQLSYGIYPAAKYHKELTLEQLYLCQVGQRKAFVGRGKKSVSG